MGFNLTDEWKEYILVFVFSLAIVFGNAYLILVNHGSNFSSDEASYLALAKGDFQVSITHRYRIIVPLLARVLAEILHQLAGLIGFPSKNLPIGFSFFIINSTIMSLAATMIYYLTKAAHIKKYFARFLALLGVLTSGYCSYLSGIAIVDSLYFLMIILLFYSVLIKSEAILLCCLLIGPLAKESFWIFMPFILLFARFTPIHRLIFYLILSACIFTALTNIIDNISNAILQRGIRALDHLDVPFFTFQKLFSLGGFISWFSVFGFFNFVIVIGLVSKRIRLDLNSRLTQMQFLFLVIILIHILLSGDIGRMWYLAAPVYAIGLGLTFERFFSQYYTKKRKIVHMNKAFNRNSNFPAQKRYYFNPKN